MNLTYILHCSIVNGYSCVLDGVHKTFQLSRMIILYCTFAYIDWKHKALSNMLQLWGISVHDVTCIVSYHVLLHCIKLHQITLSM